MKFSDENKTVKEFSDAAWFGFGVHEVTVGAIELGKTPAGAEYVEVTVLGDNDEEDTARVWFSTDKAANYSFNTLRQIYVHCAPEAKKDAAGNECDAVADTDALVALLQKIIGCKIWFTKYQDPTRTYPASDGTVRKSVNKNVYGYKPQERTDLMPTNVPAGGDATAPSTQAPSADASAAIPDDGDWTK